MADGMVVALLVTVAPPPASGVHPDTCTHDAPLPCPRATPPRPATHVRSELRLLARLGAHPNIIGLHGFCCAPPDVALVTELMDFDLYDYIHRQRQVCWGLGFSSLNALNTLESVDFFHENCGRCGQAAACSGGPARPFSRCPSRSQPRHSGAAPPARVPARFFHPSPTYRTPQST